MSIPYYRFYPGDYDRDTKHLSLMQHGAYRLLIDWYMSGTSLPNDLEKINRTLHATSREEQAAVEYVLVEFFRLDGGHWKHKRCDEELVKISEKSKKAKESVDSREKQREERRSNDYQAIIERSSNDHLSNSHKPIAINQEPIKALVVTVSDNLHSVGLATDDAQKMTQIEKAQDILDGLNSIAKTKFRASNPNGTITASGKLVLDRLKEGYGEDDFAAVILGCKKRWQSKSTSDGKSMMEFMRPKTLFCKTNFENYLGMKI